MPTSRSHYQASSFYYHSQIYIKIYSNHLNDEIFMSNTDIIELKYLFNVLSFLHTAKLKICLKDMRRTIYKLLNGSRSVRIKTYLHYPVFKTAENIISTTYIRQGTPIPLPPPFQHSVFLSF